MPPRHRGLVAAALALAATAATAHVVSLVTEGVFERLPGLRFLAVEERNFVGNALDLYGDRLLQRNR